jgi:hypothetical protein
LTCDGDLAIAGTKRRVSSVVILTDGTVWSVCQAPRAILSGKHAKQKPGSRGVQFPSRIGTIPARGMTDAAVFATGGAAEESVDASWVESVTSRKRSRR